LLPGALPTSTPSLRRCNSLFPSAAGPVRSTSGQTATGSPRDATGAGLALLLVRLAVGMTHRATRDVYPLASSGLAPVLTVAGETRATRSAQGPAGVDAPHGSGASALGARTHRQRAVAQAWPTGVAEDRAHLHAEALRREPRQAASDATLIHVYAQPGSRQRGV